MTTRERILAILGYRKYDRLPILHFGFWKETYELWAEEGYVPKSWLKEKWFWRDSGPWEDELAGKLGFDSNWDTAARLNTYLLPEFEEKVVAEFPDGSQHFRDKLGVVVLKKPGKTSIPAEIEHLLVDRASWEEHYKPRMQFSPARVLDTEVRVGDGFKTLGAGGLKALQDPPGEKMRGIHVGSLYGKMRDIIGLVNMAYMQQDDEELFMEILGTFADLSYRSLEYALELGCTPDYIHFWEDICFKNGPLVNPSFFREAVGSSYKKITDLAKAHGINIVSLDCDGVVDSLVPIWFENGVNVMFPIEVGTWDASIKPFREQYGKGLLAVGGVRKHVMAQDKAAIDAEVERLKPLVELGGFIPCPDHRIPPDCDYKLVAYYCERMRKAFC